MLSQSWRLAPGLLAQPLILRFIGILPGRPGLSALSPDESDMWSGVSAAAGLLAAHLSSAREEKTTINHRKKSRSFSGAQMVQWWGMGNQRHCPSPGGEKCVWSCFYAYILTKQLFLLKLLRKKPKLRILAWNSLLISPLDWKYFVRTVFYFLITPSHPQHQALPTVNTWHQLYCL